MEPIQIRCNNCYNIILEETITRCHCNRIYCENILCFERQKEKYGVYLDKLLKNCDLCFISQDLVSYKEIIKIGKANKAKWIDKLSEKRFYDIVDKKFVLERIDWKGVNMEVYLDLQDIIE